VPSSSGNNAAQPFRIGTSGFIYEHWRGRYYEPADRGRELERYAADFDTVELNVTFYRMPARAMFESWAARVPSGFLFAVKASRYLTHTLRLRDPRPAVDLLVERATALGSHLGPVLIQLPPDMLSDLAALDETLRAFPPEIRVAVEPRHESWFTDQLCRLLSDRGAALCLADRRGPITPAWRTADWTYLRFHGGRARPSSCYAPEALDRWAAQVASDTTRSGPGFAYFNNDGNGCALRDAAVFGRQLATRGVLVGTIPGVAETVARAEGAPRAPAGMGQVRSRASSTRRPPGRGG
jgi:uncharacterized protein YecE (DUF72 family)